MSTKGGVGKTKICAGLGRALKQLGFKVGFFDGDWVAPTLHVELNTKSNARMSLINSIGDTINPVINPEGFPLVSSAFIFPDNQAIMTDEESKVKDIMELMGEGVIDWGGIDYLMIDTPPSTEKFIQSALQISHLHGVVIVSQPAIASLTDVIRTVSLMRDLQIPIIGLVGNQVYLTCPTDGERINLYDLSEEDLQKFCDSQEIPFLGGIPHIIPGTTPFNLDGISEKVVNQIPVTLKKLHSSALPYRILIALARKRKSMLNGKTETDNKTDRDNSTEKDNLSEKDTSTDNILIEEASAGNEK